MTGMLDGCCLLKKEKIISNDGKILNLLNE